MLYALCETKIYDLDLDQWFFHSSKPKITPSSSSPKQRQQAQKRNNTRTAFFIVKNYKKWAGIFFRLSSPCALPTCTEELRCCCPYLHRYDDERVTSLHFEQYHPTLLPYPYPYPPRLPSSHLLLFNLLQLPQQLHRTILSQSSLLNLMVKNTKCKQKLEIIF